MDRYQHILNEDDGEVAGIRMILTRYVEQGQYFNNSIWNTLDFGHMSATDYHNLGSFDVVTGI